MRTEAADLEVVRSVSVILSSKLNDFSETHEPQAHILNSFCTKFQTTGPVKPFWWKVSILLRNISY